MVEHAEPKKKRRSVAEDRRLLDKVILPKLGRRKIKDLSRADVARLHHELRATPYLANRVLALFSKTVDRTQRALMTVAEEVVSAVAAHASAEEELRHSQAELVAVSEKIGRHDPNDVEGLRELALDRLTAEALLEALTTRVVRRQHALMDARIALSIAELPEDERCKSKREATKSRCNSCKDCGGEE